MSQPKRKEALGVGIWWWWPSIVVSPIILVRPPIRKAISSIPATSKVTRCDICWRITATATIAVTRIVSIAWRSRRISIIITEIFNFKQNRLRVIFVIYYVIVLRVICMRLNKNYYLPSLVIHVHATISISIPVSVITP